ncbi:protein of unknown function [Caballeronia sp. S22]
MLNGSVTRYSGTVVSSDNKKQLEAEMGSLSIYHWMIVIVIAIVTIYP